MQRKIGKLRRLLFPFMAGILLLFSGCSSFQSILSDMHSSLPDSEEVSQSDNISTSDNVSTSENDSSQGEDIVTEGLSIHFLELGNKTSGDCTLIKAGDTEILIDAGSTEGSAATIVPYIKQYCTDGVLEYVIATHAHKDHIAAFVGTTSAKGVFHHFECKTIIDFPLTDSTSKIYQDYLTLRNLEVQKGATHYTALECYNNENGASRSYTISEGVTMNFLYQKFYEQKHSDENNYSVCMLLSQGENHYLFTGDLEKAGEQSLVENNSLPKCKLFKGGHHGSATSSNDFLLEVIQPEIVCVCCCSGDSYNFPTQDFINRVAKHTDKLYVTTMVSGSTYAPVNGNIVVSSNGGEVTVNCSNHNLKFKDTPWFKENRICPTQWAS